MYRIYSDDIPVGGEMCGSDWEWGCCRRCPPPSLCATTAACRLHGSRVDASVAVAASTESQAAGRAHRRLRSASRTTTSANWPTTLSAARSAQFYSALRADLQSAWLRLVPPAG